MLHVPTVLRLEVSKAGTFFHCQEWMKFCVSVCTDLPTPMTAHISKNHFQKRTENS